MADQQKESSSVDSKEGSSLLEEGIGKGFLSSWKSISMADDDPIDFSFDSVSKGKKKTFDFDKLDMDFNLDGEFDKISSFKVDMSDLDFSCSPKIPSKSKKSKGGESSGAEGKRDGFDFNFDFNELDSFNLDSSLIKGDKTSTTNLNKKGVVSDGSDSEGAKEPKPNDYEQFHASNDSIAMKPLASEAETSKVEIRVGNKRDLDSTQEGSVSKVSSAGKLDMLIDARTTSGISKTSSTEEKDQERELSVRTNSSESKSQDIKSPTQSFGLNFSNGDTISDQHTEVYSPGTKVLTGSGGKQNVINNKVTNASPDGVKLQLENSSPLQINKLERRDGGAIELDGGTQAEAINDPQPIKNGTSSENNTKTVVLKNISHDNDIKENQKATLDGHLATANSKPVVDKMMLMKDKEIKGIQSKFFCKTEDTIPLKRNLLTGTKDVSFDCKGIGAMQLGSITKARERIKSDGSECGTKLVSDSTPATSEPVRQGEGIVSDGIPSGGKFAGKMQPVREVKESKNMLLETDVSSKEVNLLSSQVNPSSLTEKTARHATQTPENFQAHSHNSDKESCQKTIEGNKLSSIKAAKITPVLSSFKTLRSIGTNKVSSTSIRQKETNSSVNSEHMEIQGITAPKIDHLVGSAESQKPATSFLKRKANEVSEADLVHLRSLKRLSRSPSKNRSSKECPEKVVEQVESRRNSLLCNSPNLLRSPPEINLMEMKLPASVLVEDNGNVEKAEACTKELEDICIKLKKKHEEAKELVVRAVVNNNNLLMLNHPIYEEKIRKVQKLALQLMSKRIQT